MAKKVSYASENQLYYYYDVHFIPYGKSRHIDSRLKQAKSTEILIFGVLLVILLVCVAYFWASPFSPVILMRQATSPVVIMSVMSKTMLLTILFIIFNGFLYVIFFVLLEKKTPKSSFAVVTKTFNRWALPATTLKQQLDCHRIVQGDLQYLAEMAKHRVRIAFDQAGQILDMSCSSIRSRNYFTEEIEDNEDYFPLAQARTIYKDYPLLEMDLAATYSPHNWYCYVLDSKSDVLFKRQVHALSKCFTNILITDEHMMTSAGDGITEAFLDCLTRLTKPNRTWKYISLLQNHDTVIKTHVQIVQILKWMNGTNDAEILEPGIRMDRKLNWTVSALALFHNSSKMASLGSKNISLSKGSVAATLSRQMVEYVLNELNLTEMIKRLNAVEFGQDELLFPTLNSVDIIEAPGGASQICIEKGQQVEQLTRAAIWVRSDAEECATNHMRHGVCVLGMEDLGSNLLRWPHLFANKFLPHFDLGASVCWYETLFNRTHLNSHEEQVAMLDKEFYLQLPNVRFQKFKKQIISSRNQSNTTAELTHAELMQFECVIEKNLKYPL